MWTRTEPVSTAMPCFVWLDTMMSVGHAEVLYYEGAEVLYYEHWKESAFIQTAANALMRLSNLIFI